MKKSYPYRIFLFFYLSLVSVFYISAEPVTVPLGELVEMWSNKTNPPELQGTFFIYQQALKNGQYDLTKSVNCLAIAVDSDDKGKQYISCENGENHIGETAIQYHEYLVSNKIELEKYPESGVAIELFTSVPRDIFNKEKYQLIDTIDKTRPLSLNEAKEIKNILDLNSFQARFQGRIMGFANNYRPIVGVDYQGFKDFYEIVKRGQVDIFYQKPRLTDFRGDLLYYDETFTTNNSIVNQLEKTPMGHLYYRGIGERTNTIYVRNDRYAIVNVVKAFSFLLKN